MAHATDSDYNPLDPHGDQAGHHGHFIVPWQTLLVVLITLLFFTLLTVFVARSEVWVSEAMGWHLPQWVNVAGVIAIATVKAALVCMFFMGLKYDKPLNSFVLLFSLACVGLFVSFTMLDLGTRGVVSPVKKGYVIAGGTGEGLGFSGDSTYSPTLAPTVNTGSGTSIAQYAFERKLAEYMSEEEFWADYYQHHYLDAGKEPHQHPRDHTKAFEHTVGGHGGGHEAAADESDANQSRPRTGTTEGLFDEAHDKSDDAHGG